ncbi:GNAT family N-acetyltransferase [Streptomyces sp. A7024]|uniref:GNAT family N-acetyltransferase n=1 Tax=Streptomyces coryli TaxID=1128680 RepID=A0A6G4U015_9ACTN|nr:GNAT family N-acetyltransferase [Streptomyces coryli]NGN64581.1 GNAT family N-acetyltransferase [Streptomyces coryli]
MGFVVRAASPEDAPAVCALLNEIDVLEIGHPETDLHTVEADLRHPDADLPHNSWLAFADGRLVAYALLWDDSGGERIDVDHYVLPEHQAAGLRLVELMEARASAKAAGNGAERAVVHLGLTLKPTIDTAVLRDRGWRPVRRYHVMTRPVSKAADPAPELPPDVRLRACTTEADKRRAHDLLQLAMSEHFDFHPMSYETWLADPGNRRFDGQLIWIAAAEGRGDIAALRARNDRDAMGWVSTLGVLDAARGRGLGGLLLRHAFAAFAERGRDVVGLGVDTSNPTGALRLYERHGMSVHYAVDTWEVVVDASPGS